MVVIAKHRHIVESLGLATLAGVKKFHGDLVKDHRGRRDIFRIATVTPEGQPLQLFLKRNWKPYKKDGLASLAQRGAVWSMARQEWENSRRLQQSGLEVAEPVAYGEENGPCWEHFSFLITEAAEGISLEQFLIECRDQRQRREVIEALAREIQKLHQAGLATPDLFTRHIFVQTAVQPLRFCFIDMARLHCHRRLSARIRARDLAALNASAKVRHVSASERLRFLRVYAGSIDRHLVALIAARMKHLLQRGKFRDFQDRACPQG